MTALEKEKRYTVKEFRTLEGLPERCELIDGYIYDMAPSPSDRHQEISVGLSSRIWTYIRENNGKCKVRYAPADVDLDDKTTVQPDVFVVCDPNKFDEHGCNGAPDWVIEILSPSNQDYDLKTKLFLYSDAGVKEYWIVDPVDEKVMVYLFGAPNTTGLYTFDDEISVGIYKDSEVPLKIRIRDIL